MHVLINDLKNISNIPLKDDLFIKVAFSCGKYYVLCLKNDLIDTFSNKILYHLCMKYKLIQKPLFCFKKGSRKNTSNNSTSSATKK